MMNVKAINIKLVGKAVLLTVLVSVTAPTIAAEYWLRTGTLNVTMPDQVSVAMWGFAKCTDATFTICDNTTVPGPALVVAPGDSSGLTVHLRNTLAEPVSLIINGQITAMTPVWNDGTTGARTSATQRVRSFTQETAPLGGTTDYTWLNLKPGSFLYQSGTHPQVQVQMGLYGAITNDAALNQAYPGVPYDQSVTLLFSEIDPVLHAAVAGGTYGTVAGPTSTLNYDPRYFLINGKAFTPGDAALAEPFAGQRVLLRFLNAGLRSRVPSIANGYLGIVAEDGNPYPWGANPRQQYTVFLPAAKTIDAVFVGQTPVGVDSKYVIYDRRLALNNDTLADGGMMTYLTAKYTADHAPVANADSYGMMNYQASLNVPAAGVLANDTDADGDPLTVAYFGAASTGTVTGNPDGSFSYAPPATSYTGTATFVYGAKDAILTSTPATVSVQVFANRPPLTVADTAVAPRRTGTLASYPAVQIAVLGNDTDPDTVYDPTNTINPASVTRSAPSNGGSATIDAVTGVISYKPALNFVGTETFTYRVRDTRNAISPLPATLVTVTVGP